jgi:hypothetical protein
MGGLGLCLCCKKDKLLTEHHYKEIREKIMICSHCHTVIESYSKLIEKYSNLVPKEHRPSTEKDSFAIEDDEDRSPSIESQPPRIEVIENKTTNAAATITEPPAVVSPEQVQALKELIDQVKKNDKTSVSESSDEVINQEIEQRPKKHKYW